MFTGSKEAQTVPFAADMFVPQSYLTSFLGTLESSFIEFQVWLVGFLTKMSNLHQFCSFRILWAIAWFQKTVQQDVAVADVWFVSHWWQKPLVTHFHLHVVPLRVVLWRKSRGYCGQEIFMKERFLCSWISSHGNINAFAVRVPESLH